MSGFDQLQEQAQSFIDQGEDIANDIIDEIGGSIGGAIDGFFDDVTNLGDAAIEFLTDVFGEFDNGFVGIVQNIIEDVGNDLRSFLSEITQTDVSEEVTQQFAAIKSGSGVDTTVEPPVPYSSYTQKERDKKAAELLSERTGTAIPAGALSALVESVDVTVAGTVVADAASLSLPNPFVVGSDFTAWESGTPAFTYISSVEELNAEFTTITRPISEVIVHWTETYTDANLNANQIDEQNKAFGLSGIGYHYVIKRDGSLQRGRPVNIKGEHCNILNHDEYSIGIVFVGGVNISSQTDPSEEFNSASSITRSQFNTFNKFMETFFFYYPGGQALGHRDVDETQEDPGFDVIDYCFAVFGKSSLYEDPYSEVALSPQQILERQVQSNILTQSIERNQ